MDEFCIYVATHPGDYLHCKVLCQSIRYFCGDAVPIVLVKDGDFDTAQVETLPNIQPLDPRRLPAQAGSFARGRNKIRLFYDPEYPRYLYLDADMVLVSNILDLPYADFDFYTTFADEDLTDPTRRENLRAIVIDFDRLPEYDPDFVQDRIKSFNTGAFFAVKNPELVAEVERAYEHVGKHGRTVFKLNDQGVLNYVINLLGRRGSFQIGGSRFTITPSWEPATKYPPLTLEALIQRQYTERRLIHYTQPVRRLLLRDYPFSFPLTLFYQQYYDRFPPSVRRRDELAAVPALLKRGWLRYRRRVGVGLRKAVGR